MDSAASLDVRTPPESAEVECEAAVPVRQAKLLKRVVAKGVRIASQPGFVLHSYPYKETSLIIEVFSRDYGRVALVAKGPSARTHNYVMYCKLSNL
jgi:DNA repair protein RecO (recombination protein O)